MIDIKLPDENTKKLKWLTCEINKIAENSPRVNLVLKDDSSINNIHIFKTKLLFQSIVTSKEEIMDILNGKQKIDKSGAFYIGGDYIQGGISSYTQIKSWSFVEDVDIILKNRYDMQGIIGVNKMNEYVLYEDGFINRERIIACNLSKILNAYKNYKIQMTINEFGFIGYILNSLLFVGLRTDTKSIIKLNLDSYLSIHNGQLLNMKIKIIEID